MAETCSLEVSSMQGLHQRLLELGDLSFIHCLLICKGRAEKDEHEVVANALDLMCSCYGSHVLRSLLCVCKGVSVDALEDFHTTKKSATLVKRLSTNAAQSSGNISQVQNGFPELLKFLIVEMLKNVEHNLATLRVNQYGSLVLQEVVANALDLMCSCYGSHVLRSLLCVCKGVSVDALEDFHTTKKSATLVKRLSTNAAQSSGNISQVQNGFPELLKFLIVEMLKNVEHNLATLRVNQYGSLVLQTALRLLVGEDQELMQIIRVLIGFHDENDEDQNLKAIVAQDMVKLLDDNAYSHLMEVSS
ncbi:hypothetical protein Scep_012042 [Stephania cephalantha]|uniref:Uncharacterized protein n=1 Tax=Stephania cephalantha TaxID=152367 RepID=A0AAP0JEH1_9MAGN